MKDEENELGADIFSALEASSLVIDTFLNIDLGTATTFNLVINNKFMGCAIAPGLMTSAKALVGDAAQIKAFDYDGAPLLLGFNTNDSVEGGIINGWACIVDGYIRKIKEKYNLEDLRVFITGGDSRYILSELKEKVEPVKGLVFKGLESLFELNRG
jgi:type III pantothenate kinase